MYILIQLFEPFAEQFYTARRLKCYKSISNYRLDENGNTYISLQADRMSFKFIGLDHLYALNVNIPQQIYQEVDFRRNQAKENEAKNQAANNQKSLQDSSDYTQ